MRRADTARSIDVNPNLTIAQWRCSTHVGADSIVSDDRSLTSRRADSKQMNSETLISGNKIIRDEAINHVSDIDTGVVISYRHSPGRIGADIVTLYDETMSSTGINIDAILTMS